MRSLFALLLSWLKKLFRIDIIKNDPTDDPSQDAPGFDLPEPGPGEVVCYYGCPNSKKAQKLQLSKKLYR